MDATTLIPVFFSPTTKKMVCLDKEVSSPGKVFLQTSLPTRLNNFEIISYISGFRPHDDFVYLMSFPAFLKKSLAYLVYHFSNDNEKCASYFFWNDTEWHVTTILPKYKPKSIDRWNEEIVLLF